jgi:hypothetical protein
MTSTADRPGGESDVSANQPGVRTDLSPGKRGWSEISRFGLLLLVCLAFGAWKLETRERISHYTSLVGEGGNPLYRAEQLARGKLLYRDVACQYGPLPVYLFAGWTVLLGDTPRSLGYWSLAWGTAAMLLMLLLVGRVLPPWWALIVVLVTAFGNLINDPGGIEYVGPERVLILCFLLAWRVPTERTPARGALLGAMLGTWQLVKFGGAFVAGGALVAVDVLWLLCARSNRSGWGCWLRGCLAALVTFAVIELGLVAAVFSLCPPALAMDTLWPYYMQETYSTLPADVRYPHWSDWKHFLVAQLPLLASLCLFGLAVIDLARRLAAGRRAPDSAAWPLLVGGLFYAFAMPAYLGNAWLFYKYQFALVLAALAVVRPRLGLLVYLLCFSPGVFVLLKSSFWRPAAAPEAVVQISDRMTIDVPRDMSEEFSSLLETTAAVNRGGRYAVLFAGWGGGAFHMAPNANYGLRSYLVTPLGFREYDRAELSQKIGDVGAFIVYRYEPDRSPDETIAQTIGPEFWTSIQARQRPRVTLAGRYFHIVEFDN